MAANNNYKNNCTRPNQNATDKVVKEIAKDIEKASESLGISTDDIIMKLVAELKLSMSIGDIKTSVKTGDVDAPLFSNNNITFNVSVGDVTVAERGGKIRSKKKGGKNKKK